MLPGGQSNIFVKTPPPGRPSRVRPQACTSLKPPQRKKNIRTHHTVVYMLTTFIET